MTREEHHAINQAAVLKLKAAIDANYPPKQFVAIAGGTIVADDADFDKLIAKLGALGTGPMDSLIDRAGEPVHEDFEFLGLAISTDPEQM